MNRPLALRGHVTNASFKQWAGITLQIDRAHKNYITPEIWEETHLREMFYGTLIFQQSSMICIHRHVGGHTLALQLLQGKSMPKSSQKATWRPKLNLCLYLVKRLICQMCRKRVTTLSFQHFAWGWSVKFVFRKRLFIILKITFWSRDQLQTYSF